MSEVLRATARAAISDLSDAVPIAPDRLDLLHRGLAAAFTTSVVLRNIESPDAEDAQEGERALQATLRAFGPLQQAHADIVHLLSTGVDPSTVDGELVKRFSILHRLAGRAVNGLHGALAGAYERQSS